LLEVVAFLKLILRGDQNMPEPFNSPLVLTCVLAMPLAIIGLAVYWKKLKVKKEEAGKQ
jgi:hypothetical protein